MKKPKIKVGEWYKVNRDQGINKVTVKGLDDWDVKEAYEDMIDALIEANDYIIETAPDEIYPEELLDKLEQALTKAGVEL